MVILKGFRFCAPESDRLTLAVHFRELRFPAWSTRLCSQACNLDLGKDDRFPSFELRKHKLVASEESCKIRR